jgi:Sec-independent protein secretion pathway component TatC
VVSQISLAIPMCLLYELGIVFGNIVVRRRKDAELAATAPGAANDEA